MFYYSLALKLGKTVRQLLAELDSREISEWQIYFKLESDHIKEHTKQAKPPLESEIKFGMGGYNKHKVRRRG